MTDAVYWVGALTLGMCAMAVLGLALTFLLDLWWRVFCKLRCAMFLYEAVTEWRDRNPERSAKANWWKDRLDR